MISAGKLFLIPALSMFWLIIPMGFFITIIICLWWYIKYQSDIHLYFRGINHRQNEFDQEDISGC